MASIEYIAGFIDGEGSIAIGMGSTHRTKKRIYYLRLSVHQMNRAPLDALKERYGGSLRLVTSHKPNAIWEWVVSGTTAARVLTDIVPFLLGKRDQAELGLTFQVRKGTRGGAATTQDELDAQHQMYLAMRALKRTAN